MIIEKLFLQTKFPSNPENFSVKAEVEEKEKKRRQQVFFN